jgi:hypothetical protein
MRQVYLKRWFYLLGYIRPNNPLQVNRRFRGTCHLHLHDRRISQAGNQHEATPLVTCLMPIFCLASSSTLKIEAKYSSVMTVNFQRTKRSCIPDNRTLHNHRFENHRYYVVAYFSCVKLVVCTVLGQPALSRYMLQHCIVSKSPPKGGKAIVWCR